jgi:lipocalin
MIAKTLTLANLFLLIISNVQAQSECKTVTTVENFDIDAYASAPWYVQQQAVNSYSPIEQNYCVKAQYTILDKPTRRGYTVRVKNQAQYENDFQVEGNLCAFQTDTPSKLKVAPCWLGEWASGPYWVVAYNELEGYALISGGQPTKLGSDGLCTTGKGINNSGLWIFTRSQERDEALVEKVRSIAVDAGFDLSVLNDVDQTDCDNCADKEGTFNVGFGIQRDCDWVATRFYGCYLWSGECPDTCEKC